MGFFGLESSFRLVRPRDTFADGTEAEAVYDAVDYYSQVDWQICLGGSCCSSLG